MRSPLLLAATLAVGILAGGRSLHAQASANASTTVRADVVTGLTILKIADVEFGVVPAGSGANVLLATDAGAGRFSLLGQPGRQVTVTIVAPAALTSGANSIAYAGAASVNESADDPAAATPVPVGPSFTMRLRDPSPGQNRRLGHLYVHGSVTAAPSAPSGVYTGTVTITAEQ